MDDDVTYQSPVLLTGAPPVEEPAGRLRRKARALLRAVR